MDVAKFAFLFGIGFVLVAFCLKAGLFNGKLKDGDKIGFLHYLAEFPIDATMAAIPVMVTAAAANFEEDPAALLWLPCAIIIVTGQIFFFKNIRARSSTPSSDSDYFVTPLWLLLGYGGLGLIALKTISMLEGASA